MQYSAAKRFRRALSFDDVMLVPQLGHLISRSEADLSTKVAGLKLKIPILAANMSSICEEAMAATIGSLGGLGIVHRMNTPEEQLEIIKKVNLEETYDSIEVELDRGDPVPVGFSIGIGSDWMQRMNLCRKHADIVCLDVAHGHHEQVKILLKKYFDIYKNFPIIIGQISTIQAIHDLLQAIPDKYWDSIAFKTSIGGGSLCTTRIQTGFGIPTLQSVLDIMENSDMGMYPEISLIADGGIKCPGDIVKSLAAGASAVMLGGMLAGTTEAPGPIILHDRKSCKVYRGSASFSDKQNRGETGHIEGEETYVPYKGSVTTVVAGYLEGIRSGLSYGGATNLEELRDGAEFVEITLNGHKESLPYGKVGV